MDRVEKLESVLLMAIKRIEILEGIAAGQRSLDADEAAAQQIAQANGFMPAILTVPAKKPERVALARKLRAANWSLARIARVMRTGERNIARWVKA